MPAALGVLLALTAMDGQEVAFPPPGNGRPTVVLFISTVCPVSNDYQARIADLWRRFHRKTNFFVVYPNKTESLDQVRVHAAAMRFPFPVYRDTGNAVADLAGAQVTPTAAVFARKDGVAPAYLGPIDDAVNPARVRKAMLRDAIRRALAGKNPAPAAAAPYG